jgi:hypothetical protein
MEKIQNGALYCFDYFVADFVVLIRKINR